MSGVPLEQSAWSRRKWFYAIGAVMLGQALLITILGQRRITSPAPVTFSMDIRVPSSDGAEQLLSDPAVFALPNWNGFSREGWLAFQHPAFKPADWSEPPQWLPLQTADLGNSLNNFLLSNTIPPLLIANMLPSSPAAQSPRVEVPLRNTSELLIEGELAGWKIAMPSNLPSWRHADLLTNTVVRTVVNRSGQAIATALIAGSGLVEADEYAVGLVKGARFSTSAMRREPAEYSSGNLVFRWHTQPLSNAPGVIPFGLP